MFQIIIKNNQSKYAALTWQRTLRNRVVAKNNYSATGDTKKAKEFVNRIAMYKSQSHSKHRSEHVIFTSSAIAGQLSPAYAFF